MNNISTQEINSQLNIKCHYRFIDNNNKIVAYQLEVIDDPWQIFSQKDKNAKSIEGITSYEKMSLFVSSATLENYDNMSGEFNLSHVKLVNNQTLLQIIQKQPIWGKIEGDYLISINDNFEKVMQFNPENDTLVYIPENTATALLNFNGECLYFDTYVYIPSGASDDWSESGDTSLLNKESALLSPIEQANTFLQNFYSVRGYTSFRPTHATLMDLITVSHEDLHFERPDAVLFQLPFRSQTNHYNLAWNITKDAIEYINEQFPLDYHSYDHQMETIASFILFKLEHLDELLNINFNSLFETNISHHNNINLINYVNNAINHFLLNESLTQNLIKFSKKNKI